MSRYDELADDLDRIAQHLRLDGKGQYAYAYEQAADSIRTTFFIPPDPSDVSGVGESIRDDIEEWRMTGRIERLEEYEQERPWLGELTTIDGLGPERAKSLAAAGIESRDDLEEAIENGTVLDVHGIGPSTAERFKSSLDK